jgi:hypothetical protein
MRPMPSPRRELVASAALVALVSILGGCPPRSPTKPPEVHTSPECEAGPPRNDMPRNDMPRNDMPRNGLSGDSLARNRTLLDRLEVEPIADAITWAIANGHVPPDDADHHARSLLKYIASCALDPCEAIDLASPEGDVHLRGELGLCGERYNAWAAEQRAAGLTLPDEPPWRTQPPSEGCLERVSACVLARVNALHASVRFSMRGPAMRQVERVGVDTVFREHDGTPIQSFSTCTARGLPSTDPRRNCDWTPRFVGQCTASKVELVVPAAAADARIRVCAGVYGCDDPITGDLTPIVDLAGNPLPSPPAYGGAMLAQLDPATAAGDRTVGFACPANGPVVEGIQTGYYAVMIGAPPGARIPDDLDVVPATTPIPSIDRYPASEGAVFSYREGAFFGTLFGPLVEGPRVLAGDQYACYSDVWTAGEAMFAHRLCAGTTSAGACFVNPPMPCDATPAGPGRCQPIPGVAPWVGAQCRGLRAAGGDSPPWHRPYTTYLNHPCDLYADDEACLQAVDLSAMPWLREQLLARRRSATK